MILLVGTNYCGVPSFQKDPRGEAQGSERAVFLPIPIDLDAQIFFMIQLM